MTRTPTQFDCCGLACWSGFCSISQAGWGNNLLLGNMWATVTVPDYSAPWRGTLWREVFSLLPDFLYGLVIAWLCARLRPAYDSMNAAALRAGIAVSLTGGITTYFAIANSGFILWKLALVSFILVLATKIPLALLAGKLIEKSRGSAV
jgi:hypothetical protein